MATNRPTRAEVHEAIDGLRRLAEAFRRRREALAASVGLSDGQWGLLEEISREHFMPSMFARTRASSAAAVSKTLRQLADKGLIRSSLSKTDGRQRDYELTAKGERTMAELRGERERAIATLWMSQNRDSLKRFTAFAATLAGQLETYPSKET